MDKKPEKHKMGMSLRKKKTQRLEIGSPRPIPMPAMPGAKLPTAAPRVDTRDKQKVADLVKRRMSTRFLAPGETGDVPDLPVMPDLSQIPGTAARKPQASATQSQFQQLNVDIEIFRDPKLNPEQYVAQVLANATDQEIKDFQKQLLDSRKRTSTDLQKNVFVNRTQFILISKEIDKLKSEMRALRGLLSDLHNTTSSLKIDSETSSANSGLPSSSSDIYLSTKVRKAANRSSIADLTALHMTHLQALWKQVEGAQKFLPAVPGRHILVESRNWLELNAATWKPRRHVQMILLNDHLLLAAKKKKRPDPNTPQGNQSNRGSGQDSQVKFVAERCWPLVEIEMVDLSPSESASTPNPKSSRSREHVSNAINIRVGKESFVFRNEDTDAKLKLLLAFKKTADDLKKALRAESEDKYRLRDSLTYLTSRDPALLSQGDLLKSLSATMSKDQPTLLIHVDGQPRNLRWVENQMDDLDERIAHRKFDEAVSLIDKLKSLAASIKSNLLAADLINIKIDERATRLASIIITDLTETPSQKTHVKKNVSWLIKLGFEDRAREAFLHARSDIIKKRTRQVKFEGDIPLYISQVALVQFTLVKNTVEIYNSCFDYRLASTLVKWAKEHIEAYADLFHRQLQDMDAASKIYIDCIEITNLHSTMLVDVGLDFFKDQELLKPDKQRSNNITTNAGDELTGLGIRS